MPQETPVIHQPQTETQQEINISRHKIALLREEEIKASKSKTDLEREIAMLEIHRDGLREEIPSLEKQQEVSSDTLKSTNNLLEKSISSLNETNDLKKKAEKLLIEATVQRKEEEKKRSEIIEGIRAAQLKFEVEKEEFAEKVKGFELRRDRVQELLSSI